MGIKCPRCGEYEGIWIHHHDGDECPDREPGDTTCHTYCKNCDNGICEKC